MRSRFASGLRMVLLVVLLAAAVSSCFASDGAAADAPAQQQRFVYQKAPKIIHDVLDSAPTPQVVISPTRDRMLAVESLRHPPIADLAAPMLRIGGLRINPATNGPHHPPHHVGLRMISVADSKEQKIALPPNAWISLPEWAPDGRHFAFMNYTANTTELWVGDAQTATARKIPGIAVNAAYQDAIDWAPDNRTLLVQSVPTSRGKAPLASPVRDGPQGKESAGKVAPIPTYEVLLQNRHDEDLFDYYCTSQLNAVDLQTGRITAIGKPA